MDKKPATMPPVERLLRSIDWENVDRDLDVHGYATTGPLLSVRQCGELQKSFANDALFRKTIDMARHGYGQGTYKYFDYPLPELVATLRAVFSTSVDGQSLELIAAR